jgi:IS30 family transposase
MGARFEQKHQWLDQAVLYQNSSFENITDKDVDEAMEALNPRPRKMLDYKTPHLVFFVENLLKAA